jgi:hypothetical protein
MAKQGTEVTVAKLPPCDIHIAYRNRNDVEAKYDGKTTQGPWAYMCQACFDEHGVGLGTGLGQRLVVSAPGVPSS